MAVLGRLLVSSAERLDLPDLLSIDSYAAGDWRYFLKGLVGDSKPYILKGFDVIDPGNAIGTQSCSIRVADSVTFYPGSNSGSFFHGLQEGHPQAVPLVPELRKNAVNYVYLTFSTFNTSIDTRAFWDPDKDGGVGGEFTQDVNTESVLQVQINVSTGSFPANTVPVAKITVGPVVITAIEDARDMLFRLGSGGIAPDPFNTYAWRSLPSAPFQRTEPTTQMLAGGTNPFQGADKNILTLKEWMDAVMSKLRELGGTAYWYDDTSTYGVVTNFFDAVGTTFKSKGQWIHNTVTPGLLTWSEDIQIKMTSDPRTYIIRQGNKTLLDEQVMYIPMVRNQPLNPTNEQVSWINGQTYVNTIGGAVGLFANLAKGDYVKKANDSFDKWLRVEEFYDAVNLGGSTTTAAGARSIRLSSAYLGTTGSEKGRYDKGAYLASDVVVSNRNVATIANTGGNFHWLAIRSDVIENTSNIVSTTLALAISDHDGSTAKVTSVAHGLVDGDRISITGTTNFNGTYKVEVETANIFYITKSGGTFADESGSGFYATVTTAARSTPYGFQEESASHGFNNNDTIILGATTNYNGSYLVNVINSTTFTIPLSAAFATETSGTATLAKLIVRTEGTGIDLVQGQVIDIGGSVADNIRQYLGMGSLSETAPNYAIAPGYNTLDGMQNWNSTVNENITARASKLTAMMADKAQDKTVKYLPAGLLLIGNTTNGANQEITFDTGSTLTILLPGSSGNAVITLPDVAPGISLAVNQSAYVSVDRNNATTPSIIVANTSAIPIDENVFVIAERLNTTDIYLWGSQQFGLGTTPFVNSGTGIRQVDLYNPVSTVLPTGLVTIDNVSVTANMQVLFSNLITSNNKIYKANGVGTNITSWTAQFAFHGTTSPSTGDLVIVTQGQNFANQIGEFNGTTWLFNNTVRYFNGVDYWEQSALITSTLADNTTNGTVFSVNFAGSENMIVDYSIVRGSLKETASLYITTDGINVSVAEGGTNLNGPNGVSFNGIISGSLILLRYTTTSTGTAATMKYSIKRWSDSAGGPGGVPSYTGASGTGVASVNGLTGAVTIAAGTGVTVTSLGNTLTVNAPSAGTLLSAGLTINDNTISPTMLFTYPASTNNFATIEYSILRNGAYRVGRLLIANDGSITSTAGDYTETAVTGITLTSDISAGNVRILYTSTNTGFPATLKYTMRSWS